jgi:hypothetical protein
MNIQVSRKQAMPTQNLDYVDSKVVSEEQLNALISRNPIFCADKSIRSNTDGGYTVTSLVM